MVVMSEWVNYMKSVRIPNIDDADLNLIFDHLDVNKDGEISLNEMSLFIKGMEL